MRCLACNEALSDREATRLFISGEHVDLCDHCFQTIADQVSVIETDESDEIEDE